jgi:predicted ATP-dependent Lon-type protease
MQGFMQDAKFSRGKKELLAFGGLVFVGNIDVQGNMPLCWLLETSVQKIVTRRTIEHATTACRCR